jgi:predicted AAA+ superfamily ATPase
VVRRRLFLDCKDEDARKEVCARFSQFYSENQSDFPLEAREVEYRERMVSCYPIHPEVFERLYEDWSSLEKFQRTRGVLRLMAAVIYELWMGNDAGLMIMPGSLPLDAPHVRDELTRHLPEGWNALVDREVDGKDSIPFKTDKDTQRYGVSLAARRVARAVMLGSAPTSRDQSVRGIEAPRVRLGVVQPGENIANFNDALNSLKLSLAYLYTNQSGDRFWYDTRPTLRKTVADRATQILPSAVEHEIETRLARLQREKRQPFTGLHVCPASSQDVTDEQSARLVVLRSSDGFSVKNSGNQAMKSVTDILNNRGTSPRIYKNMLAFIAPDQELIGALQQSVRLYLAWQSVQNDHETLNLDAAQNKETSNSLKTANETVDLRIKEAYCWLLVPYTDKGDMKTIVWEPTLISGGTDSIITKAVKKMIQNEAVIERWAPALLRMELDRLLWEQADNIAVKRLWEYLCTYCYLPRLADEKVLMNDIQTGVNSTEYFAFASGIDGSRYIDLKFNQFIGVVEKSGYLVKVDVAQKQFAEEAAKRQAEAEAAAVRAGIPVVPAKVGSDERSVVYTPPTDVASGKPTASEVTPPAPNVKRFYMSADLDTTRINRDVQNYVLEIIQNLTSVDGVQVNVSLEVEALTNDGFTQKTIRTISENCRTLKVRDSGFEE